MTNNSRSNTYCSNTKHSNTNHSNTNHSNTNHTNTNHSNTKSSNTNHSNTTKNTPMSNTNSNMDTNNTNASNKNSNMEDTWFIHNWIINQIQLQNIRRRRNYTEKDKNNQKLNEYEKCIRIYNEKYCKCIDTKNSKEYCEQYI